MACVYDVELITIRFPVCMYVDTYLCHSVCSSLETEGTGSCAPYCRLDCIIL